MTIHGTVTGKDDQGIEGADIILMSKAFEPLHQTVSGPGGAYALDAPADRYPFLIAVRDYGQHYLEYWCQGIDLRGDLPLNPRIDKLELYGLHAFRVKGAAPALMIYVRPMSLRKHLAGEQDIFPDLDGNFAQITLNGQPLPLMAVNRVREAAAENVTMGALLLQAGPIGSLPGQDNLLELTLRDRAGDMGWAGIFLDEGTL